MGYLNIFWNNFHIFIKIFHLLFTKFIHYTQWFINNTSKYLSSKYHYFRFDYVFGTYQTLKEYYASSNFFIFQYKHLQSLYFFIKKTISTLNESYSYLNTYTQFFIRKIIYSKPWNSRSMFIRPYTLSCLFETFFSRKRIGKQTAIFKIQHNKVHFVSFASNCKRVFTANDNDGLKFRKRTYIIYFKCRKHT